MEKDSSLHFVSLRMTVLYLDLLGKGESGGTATLAFPPSKKMKIVIPNESADWRRNEESPFRKTVLSLIAKLRTESAIGG